LRTCYRNPGVCSTTPRARSKAHRTRSRARKKPANPPRRSGRWF
jgi:hypothetical protein